MPPVREEAKKRSKEQTWKESELESTLKELNDARSKGSRVTGERSDKKLGNESGDRSDKKRYHESGKKENDAKYVEATEKKSQDHKERTKKENQDGYREDRRDLEKGDRQREDKDRSERQRENKDRSDRHSENKERSDRHREDKDRNDRLREDTERNERHRQDRERSDRHREDRDRSDRHKEDKERSDRHREDKERSDRHRDDKGRSERHKEEKDRSDRNREDKERSDRHREDKERGDRHREEKDRSDRYREDRDRSDKHRDDKERSGRYREDMERNERHKEDKGRSDRHREEKDRSDRHREDRERGDRPREEKERSERHREDRERSDRLREEKERSDRHREDRERSDKHRDDKDRSDRHREEKDRSDRYRENKDRSDRHRDEKEKSDRHGEEKDRSERHREDKERSDRYREDKDKNSKHREDKDRSDRHREDKERSDKHREDRSDRHREDVGGKEKFKDDRDRTEQHVEDSELKTLQRDVKKSNGSSIDNRTKEPKQESHKEHETQDSQAIDEEYDDYDDDFEAYDEDFEEDDDQNEGRNSLNDEMKEKFSKMPINKRKTNSEMDELFEALNKENDQLLADSKQSSFMESKEDKRSHSKPAANKPKSFINFVSAKQRDLNQQMVSKVRKRCTELLQIIELDTVHINLFDLPPVKEYDLYMSSFGRSNAQQVSVQTNEDNVERDIQTEDFQTAEKWTQHPQETSQACGTDLETKAPELGYDTKLDESRLNMFLLRACQVVERIIEEEFSQSVYTENSAKFSCSEAFIALGHCELFKTRKILGCQFSSTDSNIILTMHGEPTQVVEKNLDKYGMIGIWNAHDSTHPQKIVATASSPACCCCSPVKASLVFAGMKDGSLVAWDLREPPTMHHSFICGGTDWLLRFPSYNTAGILKYENHTSPITALVPIVTDNHKLSADEAGLGFSFQLASLDKNGCVNIWVVTEIPEVSRTGLESDLGQSPKGQIKILKSSSLLLESPIKITSLATMSTLDLRLNPSNPNHFYVPTDLGIVLHGTRFGRQKTTPRYYSSDSEAPCTVTSVDLHPFDQPLLLAGCEDGSLRLHHLSTENAVLTWTRFTNGASIKRALWSRSCPYIMFVLDCNSTLHTWDLLQNDAEPISSDNLAKNNTLVTDMSLSYEDRSQSRPKMVLWYDDGSAEVHLLTSHVVNLQPGEIDQFKRFVEQL